MDRLIKETCEAHGCGGMRTRGKLYAELKLKDGKILGLSDLLGQIKKADASAFVDEQQGFQDIVEEESFQQIMIEN